MNITVLDIEASYRLLFDAPDAAARESIFQREIVEPFSGLLTFFGGQMGFKQWGLWPELFNCAENPAFVANFDRLCTHNAWTQAAQAVDEAQVAFFKHVDLNMEGNITAALLLTQENGMEDSTGGYSGFGSIPGSVMVTYSRPTEENLRSIKAATAHEFHHQFVGWIFGRGYIISDLAHYMVNEGLAESFGAELYGEDKIGPWVSKFDMSRLDETKARFKENFGLSDFNVVRQYIFGDSVMAGFGGAQLGIPTYAGYALGYHTVQAYLKRTGKSVVEATLIPPHQLIVESGYFV